MGVDQAERGGKEDRIPILFVYKKKIWIGFLSIEINRFPHNTNIRYTLVSKALFCVRYSKVFSIFSFNPQR